MEPIEGSQPGSGAPAGGEAVEQAVREHLTVARGRVHLTRRALAAAEPDGHRRALAHLDRVDRALDGLVALLDWLPWPRHERRAG